MRYKYKILQEGERFFIKRRPRGLLGLFYTYEPIVELKWSRFAQGTPIWTQTLYFNTLDAAIEYCYQNFNDERNPVKKVKPKPVLIKKV